MLHITPKEFNGPLFIWPIKVERSVRGPDGIIRVRGDDAGYVNNDGKLFQLHGVGPVHIIGGVGDLLVSGELRDVLHATCGAAIAFQPIVVVDAFNGRRAENYHGLIAPELSFEQVMKVDTTGSKAWCFERSYLARPSQFPVKVFFSPPVFRDGVRPARVVRCKRV
jgi:hypothetical protein